MDGDTEEPTEGDPDGLDDPAGFLVTQKFADESGEIAVGGAAAWEAFMDLRWKL